MTVRTIHGYTADQLVFSIKQALHDHEVTVVPGLIKLLAVIDPSRAQDVLDTIKLGIRLRRTLDIVNDTEPSGEPT